MFRKLIDYFKKIIADRKRKKRIEEIRKRDPFIYK